MHITGRCHCGNITYEAELESNTAIICHCRDCQMLSGSPYRVFVRVPAENFRMLSGTARTYVKTAENGNKKAHSFCPDCGSPVHSCDISNPMSFSLRLGCLTYQGEILPQRQIWCKSSLAWSQNLTNTPKFEKQ